MKLYPLVASLAAVAAVAAPLPSRFEKPRVAIIISHDSFKQDWNTTQMSGHAWAGNANLAGLPYDTVFVSDVADATALQRYRALVFAQCFAVEDAPARQLETALGAYLQAGGGVIVDGRLAVVDENGKPRDHAALDALLGIEYPGLQGDTGFRVTVKDNRHFIVRQFDPGQYLNQFMAGGLNILQFAGQTGTLLVSTDGRQSWPFLSAASRGPGRVVLFSDLTTLAGATSIFRNEPPQGFYANKLIDTAIRGLQWATYGSVRGPIPAPQLVNANMAAIVRLDADLSPKLEYQQQTFRFLTETAEQTGVQSRLRVGFERRHKSRLGGPRAARQTAGGSRRPDRHPQQEPPHPQRHAGGTVEGRTGGLRRRNRKQPGAGGHATGKGRVVHQSGRHHQQSATTTSWRGCSACA